MNLLTNYLHIFYFFTLYLHILLNFHSYLIFGFTCWIRACSMSGAISIDLSFWIENNFQTSFTFPTDLARPKISLTNHAFFDVTLILFLLVDPSQITCYTFVTSEWHFQILKVQCFPQPLKSDIWLYPAVAWETDIVSQTTLLKTLNI